MNRSLTDIGRICGRSIGSLREIKVFLPKDVEVMPLISCCPVVAAPELKNGTRVYVLRFDKDACGYNESVVNNNRNGDYFERTIRFQLKRDRVETTRLATMLMNNRLHIRALDWNGEELLLLNMRNKPERTKDQRRSGYNGWAFQLTSRSIFPAPHIKAGALLTGYNDCSLYYHNINPDMDIPVTGSTGNIISDDFDNITSDDFDNVITDDF